MAPSARIAEPEMSQSLLPESPLDLAGLIFPPRRSLFTSESNIGMTPTLPLSLSLYIYIHIFSLFIYVYIVRFMYLYTYTYIYIYVLLYMNPGKVLRPGVLAAEQTTPRPARDSLGEGSGSKVVQGSGFRV